MSLALQFQVQSRKTGPKTCHHQMRLTHPHTAHSTCDSCPLGSKNTFCTAFCTFSGSNTTPWLKVCCSNWSQVHGKISTIREKKESEFYKLQQGPLSPDGDLANILKGLSAFIKAQELLNVSVSTALLNLRCADLTFCLLLILINTSVNTIGGISL